MTKKKIKMWNLGSGYKMQSVSFFRVSAWKKGLFRQKGNGKGIILLSWIIQIVSWEGLIVKENTNHLQKTQSRIILNPNHIFESLNSEVS